MTSGLIIAAPRSGAGKTTVTLGLMRALVRRGMTVQPFKCGPDYIDPAFHAAACGRPSYNLDGWAMRRGLIADLVTTANGTDIALVEGVMGLFDGAASPGQSGSGSTADLAALTGWPIVLVLDVAGQAETAAAIALGCKQYRDDVPIAGVILNRVASARHLRLIKPAFERIDIPILGAVGRDDGLSLPERHLGLVQATEHGALEAHLDKLADVVCTAVRLDEVLACAASARVIAMAEDRAATRHGFAPPGQRIALAQDRAFSFIYPHLLRAWRAAGAEIVTFSPLADEAPDATADAIWLPGGYPELHAGRLAAGDRFRGGLVAAAARGVAVHGECGGYMVLGAGLVDAEGARHRMAGLLGVETSFAARRLHLGYRRARLIAGSVLGSVGSCVLGHEFHYATVLQAPDAPLVELTDANTATLAERGSIRGSVSGTFFHAIDLA